MTTWTLILVILGYNAVAVDHIDGFQSKESCMDAFNNTWLVVKNSREDKRALGYCTKK
ncbi:hypothetical protein BcepF1.030 [Burkholderia phage BcepF1]|uniref:Uncharacterized protein n=1 Tax=Burkholderia phage BcepF1 TaxID=2886897 RepID=A1YZT4_9CAUD|nr:hypothetical protein BcepF1.030 [Burkholderia phage BcepF1]ABL96761.1 hypothetical protein BcepF1.030 [Burkholderia phage BcepF1]